MKEKKIIAKGADEAVDEVRVPVELLDIQPIDVLTMGLIQSIRQQAEGQGRRIRIVHVETDRS